MTEEKLKKGNSLSAAINVVDKELKAWKESTSYRTSEIDLCDGVGYNKVDIRRTIDFDELKRIVTGHLEQKLQLLKDEFFKL